MSEEDEHRARIDVDDEGIELHSPMDARQLKLIESVHRGFLYQHLYAVGCLLRLGSAGAECVVVEHDEDVEVIFADRHLYVQVKTRQDVLQWGDIQPALERFRLLRLEHEEGRRSGNASFVFACNVSPGPRLVARIGASTWPSDVQVHYPANVSMNLDGALPHPWANLAEAVSSCAELAKEVPFSGLSPETLVLKLAGCVQYAAAGDGDHRIQAAELPGLFEQFVAQLQDFPVMPSSYRAQVDEPELDTDSRVRFVIGLSGSGKTTWASQAVLNGPRRAAYFDVGDTPSASVPDSLARELVARFVSGTNLSVPSSIAGLDLLRAVDAQIGLDGTACVVVLDNVHRLDPGTLRSVVEAAVYCRFILLAQPWSGAASAAAQLKIQTETLKGWSLDDVVAEFAAAGCPIDAAVGRRIRSLTAGMPLHVLSAAWVTTSAYEGDAERFCAAIEQQIHTVQWSQDAILVDLFDRISTAAADVAALLSLCESSLTTDEVLMLAEVHLADQHAARAIRELGRHGLIERSHGDRLRLHDALRSLARGRLLDLGDELTMEARMKLRDLLVPTVMNDLGRFRLWLRLVGQTGMYEILVDLASGDMFHETGIPTDIGPMLEEAAGVRRSLSQLISGR